MMYSIPFWIRVSVKCLQMKEELKYHPKLVAKVLFFFPFFQSTAAEMSGAVFT